MTAPPTGDRGSTEEPEESSSDACALALRYADRCGWPLIPVGDGKRPLDGLGLSHATRDPEVIRSWFTRWPNAGVALACKRARVVAIDVDVGHGDGLDGFESLKQEFGDEPHGSVLVARTPNGGEHRFYRAPEGVEVKSVPGWLPGVDVKAGGGEFGGYVILPTGKDGREWSEGEPFEDEPDELPAWLLKALPKVGERRDRALEVLPECAADERTHQEVRSALFAIPPEIKRGPWLRVIYAVHAALDANPRGAAYVEQWSSNTSRGTVEGAGGKRKPHYVPGEARKIYDNATSPHDFDGDPVDSGTLFATARQNGWRAAGHDEDVKFPPGGNLKPAPTGSPDDDDDAQHSAIGVEPFPIHLIEGDDLVSRTVREIVDSALLPQPALALGNVIAALGAVVGRRVETDTRLRTNFYILGIADSGAGKNHSRTFTEHLMTLGVMDHYMGPGRWSSESGLRAALLEQPSHVSQLDEFGDRMLATTGRNAAPHIVGINGFLKEVFTSANSILRGAAYADRVKNPPLPIHEPNLCIYCTATPESLFAGLSSDHVKDGLLNRFLLFFGEPEREPKFEGVNVPPSPALISDWRAVEEQTRPTRDALGDLHNEATGQNFARAVTLDSAAAALRREVHATSLRRRRALKEQGSQLAPLWQRFPEHVEKLALIRAISRDPETSTVTEDDMRWAMALAEWSNGNLVAMGEAHLADSDFERQVKKAFAIIDKGGEDGVSQTKLSRQMKLKKRDLQDVVSHLDECDRIVCEAIETRGRPRTTFWTKANAPRR